MEPTLTDFLLARFAEDEDVARSVPEVEPPSYAPIWTSLRHGTTGVCDHGPRGSVEMQPSRVLADCEAKRRIVERHQRDRTEYPPRFDEFDPHSIKVCAECGTHRDRWSKPCPTLRDLASVYAGHPDYRDEWKPEPARSRR